MPKHQPPTWRLMNAKGQLYDSPNIGSLGGHKAGKRYGRLDCRAALQAIAGGGYIQQRVFFLDEATAIAAGYRPCAVCMAAQYGAWKALQTSR